DIGVTTPYLFIAQGASVSVPLTAQVVSLGIPKPGMTVDFIINQGSGSLSAQSAVTNGSGLATVNLSETNLGAGFQISACVAGGTGPCQTIYGSAVALASLNLQFVSGAAQTVSGTNFQPLTVRVTDSSTPPNPVLGASVTFQSTVTRMVGSNPAGGSGDPSSGQTGSSIILSASQSSALSDGNGLASITPSLGSFTGALEIQFQISAGISALLQDVLQSIPPASN
ncbi:MAG TPA: hypothetical protein VND65_19790, partial [Candidatus Binatia bacterium]|nr:hypothetical protein [Candidatus Binatia bacterium]